MRGSTTTADVIDLDRLLSPEAGRSPEMQALFEWIIEQDKDLPDLNTLTLPEARVYRARQSPRVNADPPAVESATRIEVPSRTGTPPVACELITPIGARPGCLLYLHGGGWAHGDLESHARLARLLAVEVGTRVLYADYRLAPEHPYPVPLDDSLTAWRWIVEQAGHDASFKGILSISGDSAGANLAMACMLREMELRRRLPDIGLLFYGVYDDDLDSPSYQRFATGYGLARGGMAKFWAAYAPTETPGQPRQDPLLCPARASAASLAKMPPLYLNASGLDPLLCDTLAMAAGLEDAEATFEVHVHEGLHHGFMQQTARLAESRRALQRVGDFYRRYTKR